MEICTKMLLLPRCSKCAQGLYISVASDIKFQVTTMTLNFLLFWNLFKCAPEALHQVPNDNITPIKNKECHGNLFKET